MNPQSSNTTSAKPSTTTTRLPKTIEIPDGRKMVDGDKVPSPTATWRPSVDRQQSWNQEDQKREILIALMNAPGVGEKRAAGFSEQSS
ncbi:hypothetical protein B7463_g5767, partial [Scytalidium lignicola]